MGWLTDIKNLLPFTFSVNVERKTMVRLNKVNVFDLEVCHAKGVLRERPFWQTGQLDIYHLREDGTVEHTPGDKA
jgi:hypothetical protein